MLAIALFSTFLASPLSKPIWDFLPVSFIQFPFRVLSLTLVATAFLASFVLSVLPIKLRIASGVLLIGATLFLSKDYLMPKEFSIQDDSFYSTNEATTTVEDEYMPSWVLKKPTSHFQNKVEIVKGEGKISNVSHNGNFVFFDYSSDSPSVVRINTIYYPGWKAYSNGVDKAIFSDNDQGVMDVRLADGDQKITLSFGETPARILSDAISIASLLGLLIYTNKNNLLKLFKK